MKAPVGMLLRFAPALLCTVAAFGAAERRALAHGPDEGGGARDSTPAPAAVSGSESAPEEPAAIARGAPETPPRKLPWHGSTLLFDQSVTTQTVGVGSDYQSSDPVYEWWIAFKPRYFVYESEVESVSLNLWMNLYHEFTNSDTTTRTNENVLGPTYLWAHYVRKLYDQGGYTTSMTVGPRLLLPTDKESRNAGLLAGLGATGSIAQSVPIQGASAPALNSARFSLGFAYNHPFSKATGPVNDDLHQIRQDVGGRSVVSDVLRGSMNVSHALDLSASASLRITPKLGFGASYVLRNSWTYAPPETPISSPNGGGPVSPSALADPSTYRASTWVLASLDYDVNDALSLSLGYYNLTNQLDPGGQRRNVLWSPDARFFFSITGNLDAIYEGLRGRGRREQTSAALEPAGTLR